MMLDMQALPADLTRLEEFMLPTSFDEVTPDLLTTLLQAVAPGVVVKSRVFSDVTEGTCTRARLTLEYNTAGVDAGLPPTMWLKSSYNEFRGYHLAAGSLIGEIVFYRFANRLPVRSIGSFYSGVDASGQGLVLMSDFAALGGRFLGTDTPLNSEQARDAVDQLARLHGAYWGINPYAAGPLWPEVANWCRMGRRIRSEVVPRLPETLKQPHLEGLVPPELLQPDVFVDAMQRLLDMTSEAPHCLIHFDPHLGNLALDGAGKVVLIDWQFFRIGNWAHDVSYLLGGALTTESRRAWERDLIEYYLDRLAAHGGSPPSFEEAFRRYAAGHAYGVFAWASTKLTMQPQRSIQTMVARYADAMRDLGTLDLLS